MAKYVLKMGLATGFLPGIGRVSPHDVVTGDFDKYVPYILTPIQESAVVEPAPAVVAPVVTEVAPAPAPVVVEAPVPAPVEVAPAATAAPVETVVAEQAAPAADAPVAEADASGEVSSNEVSLEDALNKRKKAKK